MTNLRSGSQGRDVRRLQERLVQAELLNGEVDGVFGAATESAVRSFQMQNGLTVDGTVGPKTTAWLDVVVSESTVLEEDNRLLAKLREVVTTTAPRPAPAPVARGDAPMIGLESRAAAVVLAATSEWNQIVHEPKGNGWERIDEYIRGPEGIDWGWESRYVANRQFKWCGAFAAFCFHAAGLKHEIRKRVMPSTYRIHKWAAGSTRMIPHRDVLPGDIVLVGPNQGKIWGNHITICKSVELATESITTLEGNAKGMGPDGAFYEGVISRARPFETPSLPSRKYRIKHVVRPLPSDYV